MKTLLDACVLFPTLQREILMGAAKRGLFAPLFSPRILEEWRRAAARDNLPADVEIALLRAAWPAAEVTPGPGAEDSLSLPDENDRHVLAAAIAGGAEILLTQNLKDFPARSLARYGLRPVAPDNFLMELWQDAPSDIAQAVSEAFAPLGAGPSEGRAYLKRARLPRLGKALFSGAGPAGL
ncbi:MAG: RSP_2648 family PIN domain-containing protein [Mangrovicoccus sp.]